MVKIYIMVLSTRSCFKLHCKTNCDSVCKFLPYFSLYKQYFKNNKGHLKIKSKISLNPTTLRNKAQLGRTFLPAHCPSSCFCIVTSADVHGEFAQFEAVYGVWAGWSLDLLF